jgi:hypothetical protein
MSIGPGGVGTRVLSKRYPVEDGLTAETTRQEGHIERLIPEQSFISERDKALID